MKKITIFIYFLLFPALLSAQEHIPYEDPAAHQHELELEKLHQQQLEEARRAQEEARIAEERRLAELRARELAEKEERLEREERAREEAEAHEGKEESESELTECVKETVLRRLTGVNSPEKNAEIQHIINNLIAATRNLAHYEAQKLGQAYDLMTSEQLAALRAQTLHTDPFSITYDAEYTRLITWQQDLQQQLEEAQATPELLDDVIDECLHGNEQQPSNPSNGLQIIST
jgi:hypothetical protein